MPKKSTLVFVGRSNSGKGTQINLLQDYLVDNDVLYFGSGDSIRAFLGKEGYTNDLMKNIVGSGNLAPDFMAEWLLVDSLVSGMDEEKTLVLDGFPRTIQQAGTLDSALDYYQRDHVVVINIEVTEEEVRSRAAARGRGDDVNLEALDRRMEWYRDDVVPMLEHLRTQPQYRVIDVDGNQSPETVHQEIISALGLEK